MTAPQQSETLFEPTPTAADVRASLSAALLRRSEASAELDHWDDQVLHLQAIAYALHQLRHEPPAASLAAQLAGQGWRCSGTELVAHARALIRALEPAGSPPKRR